jgi:hypothetical protein
MEKVERRLSSPLIFIFVLIVADTRSAHVGRMKGLRNYSINFMTKKPKVTAQYFF